MQKKQHLISTVLFFCVLCVLSVATLCGKKRSFSENENRALAKRPSLSADTVLDKSFMNGVETYLSDHFVAREAWITAKYESERVLGKEELGGVYVTPDRLILKQAEPDPDIAEASVNAINRFAQSCKAPVYFLLAPTASAIYADTLPEHAPNLDQKAWIDNIGSRLSDQVTQIDVYNTMKSMREEYIYYRTDHHWTSYGAYCAYKTAIKKLGVSPISYDHYNIEHASSNFRGTLYSRCLYDGVEPDILDIYTNKDGDPVQSLSVYDGVKEITYDSLYFRDFLKQKDQYSTFLGQNAAKLTIRTNVNTDKRLLVIKDSYANAMIPFLAQHYQEIVVLDLRYVRGLYQDLVSPDAFSQVLILYNTSNFATDQNLRLLGIS